MVRDTTVRNRFNFNIISVIPPPFPGLDDVSYSVSRSQRVTIDGFSATVHHVSLTCDYAVTPWCDHLLSEEEIAAVLAKQKRERAERRRKKEEERKRKVEEMANGGKQHP